ncbi:MAG: tetratricopeptide repeat protein, partial [Verrucomicrobiota bacterium]
ENDGAAEQQCLIVEKNFPDSAWLRKARFLRARALIRLKRHEDANAIYEAEAHRLFASARKERIAHVLVTFADDLARKPADDDLDAPPPNFQKARLLYDKVKTMDIGRDLKDQVMFKSALMLQELKQWAPAEQEYRAYLGEFDPTWAGQVGSPERFRGQLKENPPPAGQYRWQARFNLADVQLLQCGQTVKVQKGMRHQEVTVSRDVRGYLPRLQMARQNFEDLIEILIKDGKGQSGMIADARWMRVRTFNLPYPVRVELERSVEAARDFGKRHPKHPRAMDSARLIALTWRYAGRTEEAIKAYEDFAAERHFSFVPEDGMVDPDIKTGQSCAHTRDKWKKGASFEVGQLRFNQKKYRDAIKQWEVYIAQYPNGEHWSQCQSGIINAEFQIGLDAVAEKKYDAAKTHFDAFLKKYPLDNRSRQIMFVLGQMHYAKGE